MAKSEPRTMRFEEDVEGYINKYEGKSFTEKFHNLVRFFKDTEKEKTEKIKELDKEIKNREERLQKLNLKLNNVSWLEQTFNQLGEDIEKLKKGIQRCDRSINDVIQK